MRVFGADTGGYLHSPPDKELFTRWFEQTALSTVMQMGNGGSTVAWEPDPKTGFDAEMLGWYRTYTKVGANGSRPDFNPGFASPGHPFSVDCNVAETVLRQLLEDAGDLIMLMLEIQDLVSGKCLFLFKPNE